MDKSTEIKLEDLLSTPGTVDTVKVEDKYTEIKYEVKEENVDDKTSQRLYVIYETQSVDTKVNTNLQMTYKIINPDTKSE